MNNEYNHLSFFCLPKSAVERNMIQSPEVMEELLRGGERQQEM